MELRILKYKYLCFLACIFFLACEKDVTIDLPKGEPRLVVEGRIETGAAPLVILSKSTGFFSSTDAAAFEQSLVNDAEVFVQTGQQEVKLGTLCSDNPLIAPFLPQVSASLGVPLELLQRIRFCIYTDLTGSMTGKENTQYKLRINWASKTYSATTTIPPHIPLDSCYFRESRSKPGLGVMRATLRDPETPGNYYRWYARRITRDQRFLRPMGSVFEDRFFNGETFWFEVTRPVAINSNEPEDIGREKYLYKNTDTVIVKFCTIDKGAFEFLRTFESEAANLGNPFAAPITVVSNIDNGATGVWAGYGVWTDTVYCNKP
jgi:hypothetical protein